MSDHAPPSEQHSNAGPFMDYLASIAATPTVIAAVAEKLRLFATLTDEPIERIFIEDRRTAEGEVIPDALAAFTPTYLLGAEDFLRRTELQMTILKDSLMYLEVRSDKYDFATASALSQLTVEMELGLLSTWTLTAVGQNCDHLREIIKERLTPNLLGRPDQPRPAPRLAQD